jgi:outer membrane protein assembly factor BamB
MMKHSRIGILVRSLCILGVACAAISPARAGNWPGWRGPDGTGVTAEKGLPVRWSATKNVRWKVPLQGAGVSAPVVWGDAVFLTASDGRLNDRLHVYCFHRADGRTLWHTRLFGSAPTDLFAPGGMAVPTPVTDGERLFVLFGTGDLACLDFAGKPVWVRSLAEEYGPFRNRWGMGSSPVLVDGLLVVQVDHWGQSYLLAIDPRSGANRWKTDRDAAVNWSTPLAVRVKGRTQVVAVGTEKAKGYDAKNGAELWTVSGLNLQCIPTPVVLGDVLYAASGENTLAVRLDGGRGDLTRTHVLWKSRRGAPFVPSPVAYGGRLYLADDKGWGTCLDAATGAQLWKERLGREFHASVLAGDGKVYYTNKEGVVTVLKAGETFEPLARNDVGEAVMASPAVSDGQIFLRGEKHLFCIGEK